MLGVVLLRPLTRASNAVKFPTRRTDEQEHISEEFFSGLPSGSFSPEEHDLRDGICWFIDNFNGNGFPTLSIMCQDKAVGRAKSALLPRGVPMKEWIEQRCGEDFDLVLNRSNQNCIGYAGTLDPEVVAMSGMERVFMIQLKGKLAEERPGSRL